MPHLFFDVSSSPAQPDEDGTELDDIAAARAAALQLCGEMIRNWAQSIGKSRYGVFGFPTPIAICCSL